MSGPTRGMVAGQAIQTQAQTAEYDEGYERTFGERKPQRGKFVWDEEKKEMVPVGRDWTDAERRAPTPTEELTYGGMAATDGTPINSRKKHRDYMKAKGLTTMDDYTQEWAKAEKQRQDFYSTGGFHRERREQIERAFYEVTQKGRKKR